MPFPFSNQTGVPHSTRSLTARRVGDRASQNERRVPPVSILRPGICLTAGVPRVPGFWGPGIAVLILALSILLPTALHAQHFDGNKAFDYTRDFANIGPRWPT